MPVVPLTTTRSLKRKDCSQDDLDELDELDRIFKRVKTVVPPNPYILSTPSLDPYRYHSQQEANAWTLGRLWKYDEENMQYRTYLYREPCQDCFELQAGERCRNCDAEGHLSRECPKPKNWSRVKCKNCSNYGHGEKRCPEPIGGTDGGAARGWDAPDMSGAAAGGWDNAGADSTAATGG